MVRVISMRETFGSSSDFLRGDVDGLPYVRETYEDLSDAQIVSMIEAGRTIKKKKPAPEVSVLAVPVEVVQNVKKRTSALSKGRRG